jgi:hypothetical protein
MTVQGQPTRSASAPEAWRPSLRLVIAVTLAGMVTFTSAAIIWTSHLRSSDTVREISQGLILQTAERSRDEVRGFSCSKLGTRRSCSWLAPSTAASTRRTPGRSRPGSSTC